MTRPQHHRCPFALALFFPLVPILLLAACVGPNGAQRAQEAAYELAMGLRFGQAGAVLEHIAPEIRTTYFARHRQWQRETRIVDLELTGLRMLSANEAEVLLAVGWNRAAETTLRTTILTQQWKNRRGQWWLIEETTAEGDAGLLELSERNGGVPNNRPRL